MASTQNASRFSICGKSCLTINRIPVARVPSLATRGWDASTGTWYRSCCWPFRKRTKPRHDRGPAIRYWRGSRDFYEEVRDGIGVTKNPAEYGAFPTDPYSHTPGNAGVQQPGMTGQVKEDILCRWGELGVWVEQGPIRFWPALLRASEFLEQEEVFHYVDRDGTAAYPLLEPDSLAFTYCQTPIIYRKSASPRVEVRYRDGTMQRHDGLLLDRETSAAIFRRDHSVERIQVDLLPGRM